MNLNLEGGHRGLNGERIQKRRERKKKEANGRGRGEAGTQINCELHLLFHKVCIIFVCVCVVIG